MGLRPDVAAEIISAIQGAILSGKGQVAPLAESLQVEMAAARRKSEIASRARVMRAVRKTWENLQKQWELNKEAGLGRYKPSPTELLAQYILKDEIAKERARQKEIEEELDEMLKPDAKDTVDRLLDDSSEEQVANPQRPKRKYTRRAKPQPEVADGVSSQEVRSE
jgi:hypothetical protein